MKKSKYQAAFAGVALVLMVLIVVLISGGFSDESSSAGTTGTQATTSPSEKISPAPSQATHAPPGRTASLDSDGVEVHYLCRANPESPEQAFWSMEEAWAAAPLEICDAARIDPKTGKVDKRAPSEVQAKALETAYGPDYDPRALYILYGICGQTAGELIDKGSQSELAGALVLCPDHPKAATIQANITAFKDLIALGQRIERETAEGIRVSRGSHLIGVDIQPGTWQSIGEVKDCFWELSDAQGQTIEKDYIRIASEVTIDVPASATGLSISGCTFKRIGP